MKKLLIGCGAVLLILGALCCGGVFWLSYSTSRFLASIGETYENLAQLDERYPFEEPQGRPLDPARLDDYLAARTEIVEGLTQRNPIARALLLDDQSATEDLQWWQMFRAFTGLFRELGSTVEGALASRSMSLKEAHYLIETSYLTMVLGADTGDQRMEDMLGQLSQRAESTKDSIESQAPQADEQFEAEEILEHLRRLRETVPPENFQIVAERRERFLEYPGMAYLEFLVLAGSQGRVQIED